jgi:hypothetical protein
VHVTDFFMRLSATTFVLGAAVLAAEYAASALQETFVTTAIVAGSILGFFVVVTIICAIWEAD